MAESGIAGPSAIRSDHNSDKAADIETSILSRYQGDKAASEQGAPRIHEADRKDSGPPPGPCCHNLTDDSVRNLVISIDGTSNKFGITNTHVIELYSLLNKDPNKQLTWYNSGIGTYARPSWRSLAYWKMVLYNKIDLAIAWNFDKTVLAAYHWLSENYRAGDRIFLFGFSRGAFQVRVLSAMIEKVGLIHKGNDLQIPFAYELYADPSTSKLEPEEESNKQWASDTEEPMTIAERFKRTFSHRDVKVHFVGAWDTVSSIGILRGSKMLPGTIDGMEHVCFFRHALALDERRVKFLPEFAYGGRGIPAEEASARVPRIKEVWFAGTHSDIGGGNANNPKLNHTRPPLRWMVFEAGSLGLKTAQFTRDLLDEELADVKESLAGFWWLFEFLPLKRMMYSRQEDGKHITWKPHCGKGRKIQPGQKIHNSALIGQSYTSKASPPPPNQETFWSSLQGKGQVEHRSALYQTWVELDLHDHIVSALREFISEPDAPGAVLRQFAQRNEGKRTLYDAIMDLLEDSTVALDIKERIMREAIEILDPESFSFRKRGLIDIAPRLKRRTERRTRIANISRQFLLRFCNMRQRDLILSSDTLWTWFHLVAFSPDGQKLISVSDDNKIFVWDTLTGAQIGFPITGHKDKVKSVAFSQDGTHIISGSLDGTIRLWDIESHTQVGDPRMCASPVKRIAFSQDGTRAVSCSPDPTLDDHEEHIRLWDVKTGTQIGELWNGPQRFISCIAYSLDGNFVASGSFDRCVRVWDVQKSEQAGGPLENEDCVYTISFSPNHKLIAAGLKGGRICLWDMETYRQVGGPLMGHTEDITSVCFSPNGKFLASGSDDQTVRVWDVESGCQVGEPMREHKKKIICVVFSPTGNRLASSTWDRTIRIWDIEDLVVLSRL